ncbi:MAG TPA: VC0807 family protein [Trebonia sp.]|nr:VC0807 family protein [Trebonia sp.]
MATTAPLPPRTGDTPARSASSPRAGLRDLVLDVAVPVGSYYVARAAGCDLFAALVISSALPLVRTVAAVVRGQKLDGLALVVLTVNAVSLGISFWSGNPRFMLAKDGAVTSVLGLAILASVLARRPLMTAGMRPFVTRGSAAREAAFGRLLDTSARFRQLEVRFSVIWAGAFLAECAARITVSVILPVSTVVWLSTVVSVGCIGAGVVIGGVVADRMEKLVSAEVAREQQQ